MADKPAVCVVDQKTSTAAIYADLGNGYTRTDYASGLKTDPLIGSGVPLSSGSAGDYYAALKQVDLNSGKMAPAEAQIKVTIPKGSTQSSGSCEFTSSDGTTSTLPIVPKSSLTLAPR